MIFKKIKIKIIAIFLSTVVKPNPNPSNNRFLVSESEYSVESTLANARRRTVPGIAQALQRFSRIILAGDLRPRHRRAFITF